MKGAIIILSLWGPLPAVDEEYGRIEGKLTLEDDSPVSGAVASIVGTDAAAVIDASGRFAFENVPAGVHTLRFTLGQYTEHESPVTVESGRTTSIEKVVDWELVLLENVTVRSASRRAERIVEAPAAIAALDAQRIENRASQAYIPRLFEFTPGVELTEGDIGAFNFNTRGFNNTLTRRVAVFVDGRSTATTFLGTQSWPTNAIPLQDFESGELVRGPSAALYGANASSGVLNLRTKAPRDSLGLDVRFTAGELGTFNTDVRYAADLGSGWYMKLFGLNRYSELFAVSRHEGVEYSVPCPPGEFGDCLPPDPFVLEPDNTVAEFAGGLRVDKYFANEAHLSLEGSLHRGTCCGLAVTGAGRFLVEGGRGDSWARFNLDWDRWNLLAYVNSSGINATGAGEAGGADERQLHLEAQRSWDFDAGRWQIVTGGFYEDNYYNGFAAPRIDAHREAIYGQVDYRISEPLNLIVAARVEDGTIHDAQFAPRASLVWEFRPNHSLRFTYGQAFQAPSLNEVYLKLDAAPPADLSGLEALCESQGVSCGLGATPILAIGNPDLVVEHTRSFEIGYRGLLGPRTFLTLDAFASRNEDFITNLLPQVGTPFGRLNLHFGPWVGPAEAETSRGSCPVPGFGETVADCVRALAPALSNDTDGAPVIVAVSHTNFGTVDTRGGELGVSHYLDRRFRLDGAANWFDYEILEPVPGFPDLLLPNAPGWQLAAGVQFTDDPWSVGLRARWVDAFRWSTGVFIGDVPAYTTFDLDGQYQLTPAWAVGVSASNLLDDQHYEFFGASILRRRVLAFMTFSR